jgi:hypothetical protein
MKHFAFQRPDPGSTILKEFIHETPKTDNIFGPLSPNPMWRRILATRTGVGTDD